MAKKTTLKPRVKKVVNLYSQQLTKAKIPFKQLIVFGSQAKGTAKSYSDIDVCVVSSKFGKNRHTERLKLMHLRGNNALDIEPHPYHPKDLKDKWDSLANEIRTHGIVV